MKLHLDTHTFMWWASDSKHLSTAASDAIHAATNFYWLSVVSVWEMLIKSQIGKLPLPVPLQDILTTQQANGLQILPVTLNHIMALESLPSINKDIFNRLLIAQAIAEGATLVSADPVFSSYPVPIMW